MEELERLDQRSGYKLYAPAIFAILGALVVLFLRIEITGNFISDGALMMLALAAYILAALFQLTNLYAPSDMAVKIGYWGAVVGVFFNLSSWLVRWVNAYHNEIEFMRQSGNEASPWIFRYVPFANLYDLSLAFAFGAGITTLVLARRRGFSIITAFTLPLAAMILVLARFIGGEFINLPPVLDSYWRPIHVGVASLSYGVALVCFAIAVMYLVKDRIKIESMAIWSSIFGLAVIATISKFSVITSLAYRAGLFIPAVDGRKPVSTPFRLDLPMVGPALAITGLLLLGVVISYLIYIYRDNASAKAAGNVLLKIAFAAQIISVCLFVYGVQNTTDIGPKITAQLAADPIQYQSAGKAIIEKQSLTAQELAKITPQDYTDTARSYLQSTADKMFLSLNANPVEFAALLTALVGTFFVLLFGFKTDSIRDRLPSLESLDMLMYKTACLAFAGLAMLLITGAIWANESWGRPWGFDSKETGALVAWLTYAAFLHTRISRGWKGRSSAYFAIIGFLFVIFTYLGVSYLLPGLHSYA